MAYAYIVRCEGIQRFVYKVDVQAGKETLVNEVPFSTIDFEDLRYILGGYCDSDSLQMCSDFYHNTFSYAVREFCTS